jgi:transposase-like protein
MVRRLTNDKKAGIVAEFVRGEAKGCAPTVVSLARAFGVSRPTIYTVLEEAGIVFPRPRRNGPALSNSNGTFMQPLSETIGAHASPVVPESEPGQQEAAENAANQS